MSKNKLFKASQFTPTKWNTAEDKARFANHFVLFVESGFSRSKFPKWFYERLSNMFGHIAHYDLGGFYDCFFTSPGMVHKFLQLCAGHPRPGDPAFTYSDVEKVLQEWLAEEGVLARWERAAEAYVEAAERAELARLRAKYPEETT